MLIKYFIYFFLITSPLAQTPLSAIDWLSKEKKIFKRAYSSILQTEIAGDIKVSTLVPMSISYRSSTNLCYWNSHYNLEKFKL